MTRIAVSAAFTLLCACACSAADDSTAPAPVHIAAASELDELTPVPVAVSCDEGATRECKITLNVRDGVVTCTTGIEECRDGVWSECFRTTDPAEDGTEQ